MLLQAIILCLAIKIRDIVEISEFIGCIGCSMLFFIFPSIAYITALDRYGTSRVRQRGETIFYQIFSYFLLAMGVLTMVTYFYLLYLRLTGKILEGNVAITV